MSDPAGIPVPVVPYPLPEDPAAPLDDHDDLWAERDRDAEKWPVTALLSTTGALR